MADELRIPDDRLLIASLRKGLQVLAWIERQDEDVGIQQVADVARLTKSNAQRILHTLWQLHYLDQDPDTHKYRASLTVRMNGYARFQNTEMFRLAQAQLVNLSAETGETCALVMLDGWDAVVVLVVPGRFASSVNLRVGMRFDGAQVTSGRLLLAFHTAQARAHLAASANDDEQTRLVQLSALETEFAQTHTQGYLMTIGAIFAENASLSAPIFDGAGRCRAAINLSMRATRYHELGGERHLAQRVTSAAAQVSHALGFRTDTPLSANNTNREHNEG